MQMQIVWFNAMAMQWDGHDMLELFTGLARCQIEHLDELW